MINRYKDDERNNSTSNESFHSSDKKGVGIFSVEKSTKRSSLKFPGIGKTILGVLTGTFGKKKGDKEFISGKGGDKDLYCFKKKQLLF